MIVIREDVTRHVGIRAPILESNLRAVIHIQAYSSGEKLEKTNIDHSCFHILFTRTTVARTTVRRSFWLGNDQFWRTYNLERIALSV